MARPPKSSQRALSPWTWLVRNPRRIAPVFAIQALVASLLVLIITPTNAFEATAMANARPMDVFTIVSPRALRDFEDELVDILDANPAQRERVEAKMFWLRMPMIVGEGYAPMIALPERAWGPFLERLGSRLVAGSMPTPGEDGVVLHEAVVRAREMALGDRFGQLVDPQDATPGRFTLVGILDGPTRVGLADHAYASKPLFVLARVPDFQLVHAAAGRKEESDAYLHAAHHESGEPAFRVIDDEYVRARIARTLANLPLVIGFISLSVGIVVALVIALLEVIAFQTRIDEFSVHLAIGVSRGRLVRKLAAETAVVAVAAWLAGLALGLVGVWLYRDLWLAPRGILLDLLDARPLLYSLSVPVLSTLTGAVALGRRLHRMDPVQVIQRRGV